MAAGFIMCVVRVCVCVCMQTHIAMQKQHDAALSHKLFSVMSQMGQVSATRVRKRCLFTIDWKSWRSPVSCVVLRTNEAD